MAAESFRPGDSGGSNIRGSKEGHIFTEKYKKYKKGGHKRLDSRVASWTGASGAVLDLCEAEVIRMVISRQVIVEADRNFLAKLPRLVSRF